MRHAQGEDLDALSDVLVALRATGRLTEKKPGIFYLRSKAFLHFHADTTGLYADVRTDPAGEFERVRVSTRREQAALLAAVRRALRASARTTTS